MLLLNPALILFFTSILISIFIVISSPSLFFVWLGLELNTLSFIPLIMSNKVPFSSGEASVKYFLTQTLASVIFIFSCIIMLVVDNFNLSSMFLCCALFIKLGAAPFHSWFPSVSSLLSWDVFYILLTIQKINPLLVMTLFFSFSSFSMIVIFLSLFIGSLMGVIQVSARLLLTYSSINQVGWLLITIYVYPSFLSWFFLLYMILLLTIILVLFMTNIQHINQMSSLPLNSSVQFYLISSLLSMGGMPPFLGFFGKWVVLSSTVMGCFYLLSLVMILTSLFVLFFYLRMMISSFLLSSNKWGYTEYNINTVPLGFLVTVSLLGLPLSLYI
nr:NADH dehydrogenase subunit 2 [Eurycercus lamellatus]